MKNGNGSADPTTNKQTADQTGGNKSSQKTTENGSSKDCGAKCTAEKVGHYLKEYLIGAADSAMQTQWYSQIDTPGGLQPSMAEMTGADYPSPFQPAATNEDQLARDLGPTLPVLLSAVTLKPNAEAAVPVVSREVPLLTGPASRATQALNPIGRVIVDSRANAMIEPVGGRTVAAGKGGVDTHTLYPNGSNYQRLNPQGHANNPTPHGHGHAPGTGPGIRGQGPSLDPQGNIVPSNSPDAHWPIK